MSDLIDRQALKDAMYHKAFETDSDMQKWDSGCWIRYKLFENTIDELPSVKKTEIIRCKDCVYGAQDEDDRWYCTDLGCTMGDNEGNGYCSDAERRTK